MSVNILCAIKFGPSMNLFSPFSNDTEFDQEL